MEVIQQPFARLRDETHEGDSWSEAQLDRPQTYSCAESWPELGKEALALSKQLSTLDGIAVFRAMALPSRLPINKPRSLRDVQGALLQQLGSVNQVAQRTGINSVIRGGGGQGCASRAALVVEQPAAEDSEVTAARVSGVIEVTTCDQLSSRVDRGDSIQAILSNSKKLSALQPAFQKVSPLAGCQLG